MHWAQCNDIQSVWRFERVRRATRRVGCRWMSVYFFFRKTSSVFSDILTFGKSFCCVQWKSSSWYFDMRVQGVRNSALHLRARKALFNLKYMPIMLLCNIFKKSIRCSLPGRLQIAMCTSPARHSTTSPQSKYMKLYGDEHYSFCGTHLLHRRQPHSHDTSHRYPTMMLYISTQQAIQTSVKKWESIEGAQISGNNNSDLLSLLSNTNATYTMISHDE